MHPTCSSGHWRPSRPSGRPHSRVRPQSVAKFADLLAATARMLGVHPIDLAIDCSDNDLILNQELKAISVQV